MNGFINRDSCLYIKCFYSLSGLISFDISHFQIVIWALKNIYYMVKTLQLAPQKFEKSTSIMVKIYPMPDRDQNSIYRLVSNS